MDVYIAKVLYGFFNAAGLFCLALLSLCVFLVWPIYLWLNGRKQTKLVTKLRYFLLKDSRVFTDELYVKEQAQKFREDCEKKRQMAREVRLSKERKE